MDLVILSQSLTVKLLVSYNLHYSYIERLLVQVNPTGSEVSNIAPVLFQYNEKVLVGFNNLNNLNSAIIPTFPCKIETYSNVYVKIMRAAIIHTNKLHKKCKCTNVTLVFCFDNGG
ncbi:hypothetical protein XELAEV_18008689mg [Xenopus laevis]|uniref:Uncharacterized protein n=1 Tax=Xenopus laevis TaxID=8355 RepID=A0A974I053_XENLA|nr:hypothetical protein XELAEV_18008689mg [Xenopus laevis]